MAGIGDSAMGSERINVRRRGWTIPCTAKRHLGRYAGDDGLSRNPS